MPLQASRAQLDRRPVPFKPSNSKGQKPPVRNPMTLSDDSRFRNPHFKNAQGDSSLMTGLMAAAQLDNNPCLNPHLEAQQVLWQDEGAFSTR